MAKLLHSVASSFLQFTAILALYLIAFWFALPSFGASLNAMASPSPTIISEIILIPPQLLTISQQAARIRTGMTFEQVTTILGRKPDTILNDAIRESIDEFPTGDDLYTFYWQNDKSDCYPVAVQFSPNSRLVTGIDEGQFCEEWLKESDLADPIGESCNKNQLCEF